MVHNISFTKNGYEKIRKEFNELLISRKDAVINLRTAREMGDLSENGYYHAAKAKLNSLDSRLRHLKKLLILGKVAKKKDRGTVEIGSKIEINDGNKNIHYEIVGGYESKPSEGKISIFSPIGKALSGRRIGDDIVINVPAGQVKYKIINIT